MCKKVVFRRKRSFPLDSYIEVRYIILQYNTSHFDIGDTKWTNISEEFTFP